MKLYYFPKTISIAAVLALHEAGVDFEAVKVDFSKAEQAGPHYHAINPKGRVPALVTDQGVVTETGAILEYIAALAPEAGLVPADALQAARMREAMYYLASTAHVNHAHKMRGARWATQETSFADMAAKVPETMTASAAYLENKVLAGPFVLGERISLADVYLYVVCTWLPGDQVDMTAFPKLTAFVAAMEARPSVAKARADGMI